MMKRAQHYDRIGACGSERRPVRCALNELASHCRLVVQEHGQGEVATNVGVADRLWIAEHADRLRVAAGEVEQNAPFQLRAQLAEQVTLAGIEDVAGVGAAESNA